MEIHELHSILHVLDHIKLLIIARIRGVPGFRCQKQTVCESGRDFDTFDVCCYGINATH